MSSSQTPPAQPIDPVWARESNTAMIVGVTGGFHALALLFVGLRVYTRMAIVKVMGRDDFVVVASVLCAVGGMTIFSVQAELYENRRPSGTRTTTNTSKRRQGYRVHDSRGEFEMHDRPFAGSPEVRRTTVVDDAYAYEKDGSRGSGSEDLILKDDGGRGIMRTTEISIKR